MLLLAAPGLPALASAGLGAGEAAMAQPSGPPSSPETPRTPAASPGGRPGAAPDASPNPKVPGQKPQDQPLPDKALPDQTLPDQSLPDQSLPDQLWSGTITLGDGEGQPKLEFSVRFTGTLAKRKGFMSIPKQGVKDMAVKIITVHDKRMAFRLQPPGMPEAMAPEFELVTKDFDRTQASGTMLQGGVVYPVEMRLLGAGEEDPGALKRPQTPKPPFEYRTREVTVTSADGSKLAGTLTLPQLAVGAGKGGAAGQAEKDPASAAASGGGGGRGGKGGSPSAGWAPPYPAVVMITGSGPQDRDENIFDHKPFLVLADALAKAGVASLRLDDRGVGGSTSASQGKETTDDFVSDAMAGANSLLDEPEIDPKRIGLLGHSEGALVAVMAAAAAADGAKGENGANRGVAADDAGKQPQTKAKKRTAPIAFIVMLAGQGVPGIEILPEQMKAIALASGATAEQVAPMMEVQREVVALAATGDAEKLRARIMKLALSQMGLDKVEDVRAGQRAALEATVDSQAAMMGSPWMRRWLNIDPRPLLEKLKLPVLVVQGEKDVQVLPEQNVPAIEAALRKGGNSQVTIKRFAGLNHLLQPCQTGAPGEYATIEQTMSPEALQTIVRWIAERGVTQGGTSDAGSGVPVKTPAAGSEGK